MENQFFHSIVRCRWIIDIWQNWAEEFCKNFDRRFSKNKIIQGIEGPTFESMDKQWNQYKEFVNGSAQKTEQSFRNNLAIDEQEASKKNNYLMMGIFKTDNEYFREIQLNHRRLTLK